MEIPKGDLIQLAAIKQGGTHDHWATKAETLGVRGFFSLLGSLPLQSGKTSGMIHGTKADCQLVEYLKHLSDRYSGNLESYINFIQMATQSEF